ncbi:MAG TPA: cytochrome d ubiquinol oxidase subunit II [Solirubrobacterales bacterium]|jgi:cytochrome d ubiquinol oxidase subunit II|nr:cytochrome d ubiquinol oxidase subunit II [Solirubrobacterales bacterium]
MSKADVAAAILWVGATFYALFGGADFGGGFWDLIAGDAERGERPRALVQRSLTPVWEANHVWLIFVLVVLWTAFSAAFSAIFTTLYVPIALAAVGIVLRGAGFAFRKSIEGLAARRAAGATFALSSVLTPFFMGTVVGAIASGNVPAAGNGDAFSTWLQPLPLLIGAMFVATGAYLSAVFLVGDARRAGEEDLEHYFVRRALAAAAVAGAAAAAGLVELHGEARYVFDRLVDQGLPLVILSALCGIGLLALLLKGGPTGRNVDSGSTYRPIDIILMRALAAGAVVAVVWGWAVAQFPYLLPTSLRIDQAAAPDPTLSIVFVVFAAAAVLVLPSLGLLYTLSQRDLLETEH